MKKSKFIFLEIYLKIIKNFTMLKFTIMKVDET